MDERARKRKAEDIDSDSDVEGVVKETPKQGLRTPNQKKQKKDVEIPLTSNAKQEPNPKKDKSDEEIEAAKQAKAEAKKLKAEKQKEKATKKAEDRKAKKAGTPKKTESAGENKIDLDGIESGAEDVEDAPKAESDEELDEDGNAEVEKMQLDGLVDDEASTQDSTAEQVFDSPAEPSANTSTSSTIPPGTAPKHIKIPTDPELLKSRLAARIEALRAARKADGPDGAPARNRQELMEARRKKEEQRRAHKKELRQRARIEEDARREEALASARDSPASAMMSPAIDTENNFSFGRVAFADGQHMNDDLTKIFDAPKKRGPQDAKTALEASEKKRLRISGLDEEKRADIEEKELWLAAKKRAHGEKVRDDSSLLKKTLKRKEKAKKKSESEWKERKDGVAKGQAMKQKKREENLQKRKDEKGGKGKKKAGSKGKPKVKSRPGFEGSFGGKRK